MAKDTNRNRPRNERAGARGEADPVPGGPWDDLQRAIEAGYVAEGEQKAALKAMDGIAVAAAEAREAIYCALRAAEYAEMEAVRVLEDAKRIMHSARVRVAKVRKLFRVDEAITDDFDGGERAFDQADQGETRAIESSLRAVDRAMQAANVAQSGINRDASDYGRN
jgi:hypothetical protein